MKKPISLILLLGTMLGMGSAWSAGQATADSQDKNKDLDVTMTVVQQGQNITDNVSQKIEVPASAGAEDQTENKEQDKDIKNNDKEVQETKEAEEASHEAQEASHEAQDANEQAQEASEQAKEDQKNAQQSTEDSKDDGGGG